MAGSSLVSETGIADAAVIICAYTDRRWDDLERAVASVEAQSVRPCELLVVVDNNPSLLHRAGQAFPGARVVENHHGQGLSGARNSGFDHARSAVLAFLDDDAFAEPQWLASALGVYEDARTLGAGGEVVPVWRAPRPRWFADEFNWVVGCTWTGMSDGSGPIRNPIGANFTVLRSVFAATGGFEQALGRRDVGGRPVTGTADETEFCIRAVRHHPGHQFVYVPDARVHHVVPPERSTWAYFRARCRLEGSSKAILTGIAGSRSGLASERRYATSVLPRAVLRGLGEGSAEGVLRAGAVIAGLGLTAGAYAQVRAAMALGRASRWETRADGAT